MPIDYKKYPDNWETEIRPKILKRAQDCCELCGAINKSIIKRFSTGKWTSSKSAQLSYLKETKIVLTIHHINHDIKDNRDCNLIALCQRCHLRLDRPYRNKKKESK